MSNSERYPLGRSEMEFPQWIAEEIEEEKLSPVADGFLSRRKKSALEFGFWFGSLNFKGLDHLIVTLTSKTISVIIYLSSGRTYFLFLL
jgi:hypothetical protein